MTDQERLEWLEISLQAESHFEADDVAFLLEHIRRREKVVDRLVARNKPFEVGTAAVMFFLLGLMGLGIISALLWPNG